MGKGRRWTEKQLLEKIAEIKATINSHKRRIKEYEEEIEDIIILLDYYEKKLVEKRNNPSSRTCGKKE